MSVSVTDKINCTLSKEGFAILVIITNIAFVNNFALLRCCASVFFHCCNVTHCILVLFTFMQKMPLNEVPVSCFSFAAHAGLIGVSVALLFLAPNPKHVMACC